MDDDMHEQMHGAYIRRRELWRKDYLRYRETFSQAMRRQIKEQAEHRAIVEQARHSRNANRIAMVALTLAAAEIIREAIATLL